MKKIMKRLVAIVCVAVLLVGVISSANLGQVQATDTNTTTETLEKTVEVQKLEGGTVTPGNGTEEYSKEGYLFGGYFDEYDVNTKKFSNPITGETPRTATTENPIYIKWVPEKVMTVKAQVRQDEYKKVLTSCDSKDEYSNISASGTIDASTTYVTSGEECSEEGFVKEGKGSLKATVKVNTATERNTYYNIYLKNSVDVRGYKYFSCKLYLSETDYNGLPAEGDALCIVLNSRYSNMNYGSLHFILTKEELHDGWNDLKLSFAQAELIRNNSTGTDGLDFGTYSGAAINYIRIFEYGGGTTRTVTTYLDDVCVLNDKPGIMVADCDQLKAPKAGTTYNTDNSYTFINAYKQSGNASGLTEAEGEVQEGTGAIKNICYRNSESFTMRVLVLKSDANLLDITKYKDRGYLHLWLYISDLNAINESGKFTIDMTSSGGGTDNRISWDIPKTDLREGWNEIVKPLNNPDATSSGTTINFAKINYIRVQTMNATAASDKNAYMILDDIRVIESVPVLDCDSTAGLNTTSNRPTVTPDDVKQGSGAFIKSVTTSSPATIYSLSLTTAMDFSDYKQNDYSLHFWFYIDNPLYIRGDYLRVILNSGGEYSINNDQEYRIDTDNLVCGWNEIFIHLKDISGDIDAEDTAGGNQPDWTNINCITIAGKSGYSEACTTMLDDISLVPADAETADVRFISTVESLQYRKVGYYITPSRGTTAYSTLDAWTTNVYDNLWAMGANGTTEFESKDISGLNCSEHMYAATVMNIPNRLWDATFTVIPYWVTQDGTTVQGTPREVTVNYMHNKSFAQQEEKTNIDIYLIAGQSNASGTSHVNCSAYNHDHGDYAKVNAMNDLKEINEGNVNGFSNIYYSGTAETNTVKLGLARADIHKTGKMGPEVGMAASLSEYYTEASGKVAGFIKYAYGGTSLLDKPNDPNTPTRGNWVSPSYEAYLLENGGINYGEMTGKLYENLLEQVKTSLEFYRESGYNPTIKGLYWMQGEHDRSYIDDYKTAFKYFSKDIRNDLAELTKDASLLSMPIVIGTISETFYSAEADYVDNYNKPFVEMQKGFADASKEWYISNCYVVDNSMYAINELVTDAETQEESSQPVAGCVDNAHWNWRDCLTIGTNVGDSIKANIIDVVEE